MNIYYNSVTRTISIDRDHRIITIPLPAGHNPIEVAEVIQSETMQAIIRSLTERGD